MRLVRTKAELRELLAAERAARRTVGLVPTMGFLHDGHRSLLVAARERTDVVVMSLFVNPTQFGPGEDLAAYPRDEQRDAEVAAGAGVDYVFAPSVEEIYPDGFATSVIVEGLSEVLCGDPDGAASSTSAASRRSSRSCSTSSPPTSRSSARRTLSRRSSSGAWPATSTSRRPIEVLPTIREPDGLALSSRNVYLTAEERSRAPALHRALEHIRERAAPGGRGRAGARRGAHDPRRGADRARVPRGARRRVAGA